MAFVLRRWKRTYPEFIYLFIFKHLCYGKLSDIICHLLNTVSETEDRYVFLHLPHINCCFRDGRFTQLVLSCLVQPFHQWTTNSPLDSSLVWDACVVSLVGQGDSQPEVLVHVIEQIIIIFFFLFGTFSTWHPHDGIPFKSVACQSLIAQSKSCCSQMTEGVSATSQQSTDCD